MEIYIHRQLPSNSHQAVVCENPAGGSEHIWFILSKCCTRNLRMRPATYILRKMSVIPILYIVHDNLAS